MLGKSLVDGSMNGLMEWDNAQKDQGMSKGLGISAPAPNSGKEIGVKGWQLNQSPVVSDLIQSRLHN